MAKKTVVSEVASALGAAAARVETTLKPKRSATMKHAKAKVMQADPLAPAPLDRDKVALVAYLRWEARGFQGGSPEEDWVAAEQELQTIS